MKATKKYADIATIGNTAARCKDENIPVGEKGKVPAVYTGRKALVSWANLMDFLTVSGE